MNFLKINHIFTEIFKKTPLKSIIWLGLSCFLLAFFLSLFITKELIMIKENVKINKQQDSEILVDDISALSKNNIDQIIERNIFNKEGETPEEEDFVKEKVIEKDLIEETDLPLKLLGTIYGGDPYSGLAVIEESKLKSINSFLVGDMIFQNAIIAEIHKEKIIIDRGDYKQYLKIGEYIISRGKRKKNNKKKSRKPVFALDAPPDSYEEGFERNGSDIIMSKDYKQKLLSSDFAKVLQDSKAEPYMEGGELRGFKLTRIKEDSIYQKAGLQNDDIIKEINGVSLVDTAQAIKLLNSLRGESDIEIKITRSGKMETINMQVR